MNDKIGLKMAVTANQPINFTGELRLPETIVPVTFSASVGEDSRIEINVLPIASSYWRAIYDVSGEPGSYVKNLELKGTGSNGVQFYSNSTIISGCTHKNERVHISVKARVAKLTKPAVASEPGIVMKQYLRGFQSYINPRVPMSLGEVEVVGNHRGPKDADKVSGFIFLQATEISHPDDWLCQAEDFSTYMREGLGFVNGGRLQVPLSVIQFADRQELTYYSGQGFASSLPPVTHLDLGPFIEALVSRYDKPEPFPERLWTAIGWLNKDDPFNESRFLMAMTALETVVEHLSPEKQTTIIPKTEFAKVRSVLDEALANLNVDETALEIFKRKISGINAWTLRQKLVSLRDKYSLPASEFTDARFGQIITARNEIVHRGISSHGRDLWPNEIFIREFLTQIAFKEIGYSGHFESYLNGYRFVHPLEPAETDEGAAASPDDVAGSQME